jgi:hypothetical protein
MYTNEALLDVLVRSHQSLSKLIAHCQGLTGEELNRELEGFGIPSVRLQVHHEIGAQK